MWDNFFLNILLNFIICIIYIYMDFFMWNIKILIFLIFPGWPMKPGTRPLGWVNPRAGFNYYGQEYIHHPRWIKENISSILK
jgi:hypothetical protein